LVECWVVVPRDAGSNPVFRAFHLFLGALTSKTYSFQYRTWELYSQVFFDFTDYFYPLIKLQFYGPELIRVLPISTFWLPWISDKIRFNFSFLFNFRSNYSQSIFLIPFKAQIYFFKFFQLNFFINYFFSSLSISNSSNIFSFYPKQPFSSPNQLSQITSTNQFFLFYFSNIKELSPSYTAFLRTSPYSKIVFFGSFFDSNFSLDRVSFFPAKSFFQSVFSKTTYVINFLQNSTIKIFTSVGIKTFPNFSLTTKNFTFFSPSFSYSQSPHNFIFSSTLFPIRFSNLLDLTCYQSGSKSFFNLPYFPPAFNTFFLYEKFSNRSPSIYSQTPNFPLSFNINSYLSDRFFISPYSKLFNFRKMRKSQSLYLCLIIL
jgi:hypothetical protein